ncbi:ENTPD5 [Cordylochernes scorpioides]|uniref:ENTPD5 n=1 Tax=Cordylochernes scorpioides TaxID=51811 RepID=A0ABY6LQI0_9ARAC|nr:ENTPD5 [Cordylochernes scorpioides]
MLKQHHREWIPARVTQEVAPRSYKVQTPTGEYRRNSSFMRHSNLESPKQQRRKIPEIPKSTLPEGPGPSGDKEQAQVPEELNTSPRAFSGQEPRSDHQNAEHKNACPLQQGPGGSSSHPNDLKNEFLQRGEMSGHQVSEGHYIYQPHLINRSKSRPSPEELAKYPFLINQEKLTTDVFWAVGLHQRGASCISTTKKLTSIQLYIEERVDVPGGLESGDHHQEELELEGEYYQEVKPGLSSYADNPLRAAFSLVPLLSAALKRVPSDRWATTPLLLKATAGLRLLTDAQANAILHEVEHLFRQYPFSVSPGAVSMMSGEDEGKCPSILTLAAKDVCSFIISP